MQTCHCSGISGEQHSQGRLEPWWCCSAIAPCSRSDQRTWTVWSLSPSSSRMEQRGQRIGWSRAGQAVSPAVTPLSWSPRAQSCPPRWVHCPEVPPAAQCPPPAHLLPLRTLEKILDECWIAMAHFVPMLWVLVMTHVLRCLGDTRCPTRGLPGGSGTSQTSTRYRVQRFGLCHCSYLCRAVRPPRSPALQALFLSVSPEESVKS